MTEQFATRLRRVWCGGFLALLASGAIASAQPAHTEFYDGMIGASRVELAFLRENDYGPHDPRQGLTFGLFGAMYRLESHRIDWRGIPLTGLHGIAGTETNGRVVLRELPSVDEDEIGGVAAQIVARRSGTTLHGEWRATGSSRAVLFSLTRVRFPGSLQTHGRSGAVLSKEDRAAAQVAASLHRAIRAGAWNRAHLDAKILCALSFLSGSGREREFELPDHCGWVFPMFRAAKNLGWDHSMMRVGPWTGLALEREGRPEDAFLIYQQFCVRSMTACALMADVAAHVAPTRGRPALLTSCERWRIGCAEYWGVNAVALADAARDGNLDRVDQLLRSPFDVNVGSGRFVSPLLQAVLSRSLPVVRALLGHGADPDFVPPGTLAPLFHALESPDDTLALLLLDYGATACNECLFNAVDGKHFEAVQRLLDLGVEPDSDTVPAGSPLSVAVDQGNVAMVTLLLAYGADPDHATKYSEGSPWTMRERNDAPT